MKFLIQILVSYLFVWLYHKNVQYKKTCSNLSTKTDPMVCVGFVFLKELKICFLFFLVQESLFREVGHSVRSSVSLIKADCSLPTIRHLPPLTKIFLLNRYLESVWIYTTCWYVKPNGSFFCSMSSALPINKMWNRQLEESTSQHCGGQCSALCWQYFFLVCSCRNTICFLNTSQKYYESFLN